MEETGYSHVEKCRISGSRNLVSVLNLGFQELTGVFPKKRDERITSGPLELVWCPDSGLLQLAHSDDAGEMYGENYGYRSGLNQSMVRHLTRKIQVLEKVANLKPGDTVLDIGSNDATSLKSGTRAGTEADRHRPDRRQVPAVLSRRRGAGDRLLLGRQFPQVSKGQAKVVTSIAMFYDLDDPIGFARQVAEVLSDDGIWHFEQSYMPSMLRMCSYDTICHEHLEYYSLGVVKYILNAIDMKIVDVQMNAVNGGSFAVTAAKRNNPIASNDAVVNWLLEQEERMGLNTPRPYRDFEERVFRHRNDLTRLLQALVADGKKVLGYGASTKGNVLLQFCGITEKELPAIAEVNPDKFGSFTPGTGIPIVSEADARAMKPDYFLVLPWHFKDGILAREQEFTARGGKMIFPFPEIEIV